MVIVRNSVVIVPGPMEPSEVVHSLCLSQDLLSLRGRNLQCPDLADPENHTKSLFRRHRFTI